MSKMPCPGGLCVMDFSYGSNHCKECPVDISNKAGRRAGIEECVEAVSNDAAPYPIRCRIIAALEKLRDK